MYFSEMEKLHKVLYIVHDETQSIVVQPRENPLMWVLEEELIAIHFSFQPHVLLPEADNG